MADPAVLNITPKSSKALGIFDLPDLATLVFENEEAVSSFCGVPAESLLFETVDVVNTKKNECEIKLDRYDGEVFVVCGDTKGSHVQFTRKAGVKRTAKISLAKRLPVKTVRVSVVVDRYANVRKHGNTLVHESYAYFLDALKESVTTPFVQWLDDSHGFAMINKRNLPDSPTDLEDDILRFFCEQHRRERCHVSTSYENAEAVVPLKNDGVLESKMLELCRSLSRLLSVVFRTSLQGDVGYHITKFFGAQTAWTQDLCNAGSTGQGGAGVPNAKLNVVFQLNDHDGGDWIFPRLRKRVHLRKSDVFVFPCAWTAECFQTPNASTAGSVYVKTQFH